VPITLLVLKEQLLLEDLIQIIIEIHLVTVLHLEEVIVLLTLITEIVIIIEKVLIIILHKEEVHQIRLQIIEEVRQVHQEVAVPEVLLEVVLQEVVVLEAVALEALQGVVLLEVEEINCKILNQFL
jgi:hypothetical protein